MFQTAEEPELGAQTGFEGLFREHYPKLVRILTRLTGTRNLAEELAADAFYKLYRQRPSYDPRENLPGWLYRTAMNLGLDALRATSRRTRRESQAGKQALFRDGPDTPLDGLMAEEERERVRAVIAQLKPIHGQVLLMGSSGMSCKEIAQVLGAKIDSLYVTIARAKAEFERKWSAK